LSHACSTHTQHGGQTYRDCNSMLTNTCYCIVEQTGDLSVSSLTHSLSHDASHSCWQLVSKAKSYCKHSSVSLQWNCWFLCNKSHKTPTSYKHVQCPHMWQTKLYITVHNAAGCCIIKSWVVALILCSVTGPKPLSPCLVPKNINMDIQITIMVLDFKLLPCYEWQILWVKRDKLDATHFIVTLFSAQHVSDINTSILRCVRLIRWVTSWVVSGSMCVGVTLWFPGVSLHTDTTPPQPDCNVTPTHIEPDTTHEVTQRISRTHLRIDVLISETCWALNKVTIKQVASSLSLFTQLSRWCRVQ